MCEQNNFANKKWFPASRHTLVYSSLVNEGDTNVTLFIIEVGYFKVKRKENKKMQTGGRFLTEEVERKKISQK